MKGRFAVLASSAVVAALALPGVAFADAEADSFAGICLDDLLKVSCTETESQTTDEGSQASSEGTPVEILGFAINDQQCEDSSGETTEPDNGSDSPTDGLPGLPGSDDEGGESPLDDSPLLGAACEAEASDDGASSSADAAILSTDPLGVGESEAENETTQDSFSQSSKFVLLRLGEEDDDGDASLVLLSCAQSSSSDAEPTRDSVLIGFGDESIEDPLICGTVV